MNAKPNETRQLTKRQIFAVVIGNGLEFYDFLIYAFFAAQIGRALFPTSGGNDLLLSLATFAAGFLTRPVGAFVIGRIADRRGRKPAMLLAFALMGFATVGLVITPSYASVGWLAPVLAVGFRMLQGFALGGEVGPNTAYLLEAAPPQRRGLFISFQYATQEVAVLAAGIVGLGLSSVLSPAQLDAWGWRAAFMLGAVIVPFGLIVRRGLAETLEPAEAAPVRPGAPKGRLPVMLAGVILVGAGTLTHYTLDYLTTFAQTTLHMEVRSAFTSTLVLGLTGICANLLSGFLADKYGRKRVLIGPWLALILLGVPAFMLMVRFQNLASLLAATAILSTLMALAVAPALILLTEALPKRVRASSLGLVYAVAITTFGGTAQFIDALLIRVTGNPIAPAWYMTAALILGLAGITLIAERKHDEPLSTDHE